jgi:hypothetical protein
MVSVEKALKLIGLIAVIAGVVMGDIWMAVNLL